MAEIYKEYDKEILRRIQNTELQMLKDFDNLCTNNGIEYFCWSGTAIGAVRHKGFIPWDDDIDIGLLRKDYEKLLKCVEEQLGEKYYLLNTKNDPNYPLMTTRMVLKGTRFQEECFKKLTCNFGIFLDLYCFDYVPDNEKKRKRECRIAWLKSKLMILSAIDDPVLYVDGIIGKVIKICCVIVHYVHRMLGIKPEFYYKSIERKLKNNITPTKRVAYQFDTSLYSDTFFVGDIFPVKKLPFEDILISCPGNVERTLELMYGDYMTLPPPEKRHNHPPCYLNF